MEMTAAIEGLRFLSAPHRVYLVSDSAYLLNTLGNGWYKNWGENSEYQRPNWDLWMQLAQLVGYHSMEYIKVKGHSDDPYNNYVDKLAVEARKAAQPCTTTS